MESTGQEVLPCKIHSFYLEEPYFFKYCADKIIRKCVLEEEQPGILSHCHDSAYGGHFASKKTTMKVLQAGFYWPYLFKDAYTVCKQCDKCQRLGKISLRHMMPLNPILVVELFDVWGIDFMGPFPTSFGYTYILVGVDYVSKWVEAIPCRVVDHKTVLKFLKENIFSRFGVPKSIISDESGELKQEGLVSQASEFLVGIHNNIQDHPWNVPLSPSLWQGMPPAGGN